MPTGLSREPTLLDAFRATFRPPDKTFWLGLASASLLVGVFIGQRLDKDDPTPGPRQPMLAQTQADATRLWHENGYDVMAFKSFDVFSSEGRHITMVLKDRADERTYVGTAQCYKRCDVYNIRPLNP